MDNDLLPKKCLFCKQILREALNSSLEVNTFYCNYFGCQSYTFFHIKNDIINYWTFYSNYNKKEFLIKSYLDNKNTQLFNGVKLIVEFDEYLKMPNSVDEVNKLIYELNELALYK